LESPPGEWVDFNPNLRNNKLDFFICQTSYLSDSNTKYFSKKNAENE